MKKIFLFLSLLCFVGCIKNDVPYPVIKGEVLEFEAQGQSNVLINNDKRTITLVMHEEQNLSKVQINKFKIGPEISESDLAQGAILDLNQKVTFTITTYQKWEWTIEASQPITRDVLVKNQVGAAVIDPQNRTVKLEVIASQSLKNIEVLKFKLAPTGATYTPEPMTLNDFSTPLQVTVTHQGVAQQWTVTITQAKSNVTTKQAEAWGGFAYLSGSIVAGSQQKAMFEYRKVGTVDWSTIDATVEGAAIAARLGGLTGDTNYEYRAVLGEAYGEIVAFRTEPTPVIPNMNLNDWAQKGKTWYPNATADYAFWATGNAGVTSSIGGGKDSNTYPTDDAVQGKAACITTISAPVVDLAAGNLYTGSFALNILKPLDSPNFSQNYTGRPTKLNFYYKYFPKVIDIAKKKPELLGQTDKCTLYIYLGDWEGSLKSSQLKGELTDGVIAYGVFETDKTIEQYTKESINIKYCDTKRKPTKIIIVASSSKLGEEYIGGVGSTMYLDELSFSFD